MIMYRYIVNATCQFPIQHTLGYQIEYRYKQINFKFSTMKMLLLKRFIPQFLSGRKMGGSLTDASQLENKFKPIGVVTPTKRMPREAL